MPSVGLGGVNIGKTERMEEKEGRHEAAGGSSNLELRIADRAGTSFGFSTGPR